MGTHTHLHAIHVELKLDLVVGGGQQTLLLAADEDVVELHQVQAYNCAIKSTGVARVLPFHGRGDIYLPRPTSSHPLRPSCPDA